MENTLIILDYCNGTVHIYNVDSNIIVDERYIIDLGFNLSNCEWMCGKNIEIIKH